MPRATAAEAALTARRILDHATELFATRGYGSVSLEDVAAAAGVTRGAVYHHYRNKQGIFTAVADHLQEQVAAQVVASAEVHNSPAAQLRAGCHAFLDAITHGPALRVLLIEAPAVLGWETWRRLDGEHSEIHLREAITAAQPGTDASPIAIDALTAQLSGAMNEAALWIANQPDTAAATQAAHDALDQVLSAVVPQAESAQEIRRTRTATS